MPEKSHISMNLFQSLPEGKKNDLLKLGKRLEFFESQRLFRRGEKGESLYIIRKGEVTISLASADGKEIILNKLTDGEAFGEIAMFDQGLRTADAHVRKGTVLISIDREDFFSFLELHPALYKDTIQLLCNRLRWSSELLEDFLFHDMFDRLVSILIKMAGKHGNLTDSLLEVTQEELAKMTGATREATNRSLQLLQDRGLIFLQRRRIIVPDVEQLKKMRGK